MCTRKRRENPNNTKESHQITREQKNKKVNNNKTNKRNSNSTYLSIIALSKDGLNAPVKRHRMAEWVKHKNHTQAASKRFTSDLKTHRD